MINKRNSFKQSHKPVNNKLSNFISDDMIEQKPKRTRGSSKINKENPWLFNNIPLTEIPNGMYGFVYEITNIETMKRYIGKKFFWSISGTGKKAITKESNWKSYWSSSDNVKADIATYGKEKLTRRILVICRNKADTNMQEVHMQWYYDVLGSVDNSGNPVYYNDNISGKYFRKQITIDSNARIYANDIFNKGQ